MNILITGGMGFIGSHLVKHMVTKYPDYNIINLDKLTYAANPFFLTDIADRPNYTYIIQDICHDWWVNDIFKKHSITHVIHLAAESHVDNSIKNPFDFIQTNILGTVTLLNAAKNHWSGTNNRFYHISTDEVYGSLDSTGLFTEQTSYDPRSPYSASKASSDHFVRAFHHTYGLPIVISNCSNNYGPNQHIEKLIPMCINKIFKNEQIPMYGNGLNVRDWLFVGDHVNAIDTIFHTGANGETYNIGGNNELKNIDIVNIICDLMDTKLGRPSGTSSKLITYVDDRLGHDLRYGIDNTKLTTELNWQPEVYFTDGISATIDWYLEKLL